MRNPYLYQRGGRISGPVFVGPQYVVRRPFPLAPGQRGKGIGSILSRVFQAAMPLFKRGAKAVGKQALASGLDFAKDLAFDPAVREEGGVKRALKRRAGEAGTILTDEFKEKISRMAGSGRRGRKRKTNKRQTGGRKPNGKQTGGTKRGGHTKAVQLIRRALKTQTRRIGQRKRRGQIRNA